MERSSGILMHITSLPSPYGIGTLGAEAYRFADFLHDSGQKLWQILPVNPTGFGDSPYQTFSTFAGNPYFIDLDMLAEAGYLVPEDYQGLDWGDDPEKVDFGKIYVSKMQVLRKTLTHVDPEDIEEYRHFCWDHGWWLHDYAVYMSIKLQNNNRPWNEWEDEGLKRHDPQSVEAFAHMHEDEVGFWKFIQFLFFRQWYPLKEYVNSKGIRLIGDIPIYVSTDSADVWATRRLFCFDEELQPTGYAGVPPDYFSKDGQFWGNPLYNWQQMEEEGFGWWITRLEQMFNLHDIIRIDHFRGFEAYYCIDADAQTAAQGHWEKGPGIKFFHAIQDRMGQIPVIAEDLGFLTEEVHTMRRETEFPGMKVLQFAFSPDETSDYLPHRFDYDCVVYTGTHDNTTLMGWFGEAAPEDIVCAERYCALTAEEGYCWGMMRVMYSSVGNFAIAQMQDILELPGGARMNTPSTLGGDNWKWRAKKDYLQPGLAEKIAGMVKRYGR